MAPSLSARAFDSASRWIMNWYCGGSDSGSTPFGVARKAQEKCASAPLRSSSTPSPYPNSYNYCDVNANTMYYEAGDNEWAQKVRGCLTCMDREGMNPHDAHLFCYEQGTQKVEGLWGTARGYTKAVYTAAKSRLSDAFDSVGSSISSAWGWAKSWW